MEVTFMNNFPYLNEQQFQEILYDQGEECIKYLFHLKKFSF